MDRKQLEKYIEIYSQLTQSINNSMESIQKNTFKDSLVTPEQFNILNLVLTWETCTSSLLAKETGVKKSTITAIITRLADKGLVNRIPDQNDRRTIHLQLTEKGQQVANEGRKKIFDRLMPLGKGLSPEDFKNLNVNLAAIADQMKSIKDGMEPNEQ